MSALRADERGEVSMTSVLCGLVVMLVVGFAILQTVEVFARVNQDALARPASGDQARRSLDALARQLRNLASPTPEQPQAVDRLTPYDAVFQTVHPGVPSGQNTTGVKRVRYCLDAASRTLVEQEQTWSTAQPPAVPSGTACPAPGWTGAAVVAASGVTNRDGGRSRPVFFANAATLTDVSALHVDLFVDADPTDAVAETRLSTGVFLRNQNRRPVAAFTAVRTAQGIALNGSASADPEGQPLTYDWYSGATLVGSGVTLTYAAPAATQTLTLKVHDPAGLEGVAPAQAV